MVNQPAQTRDAKGRFLKKTSQPTPPVAPSSLSQDNSQLPISQPPISAGTFGKESQPNIEEIFLEEAQKTKELKEQLAELEKSAEVHEIKGEIELPEIIKKEGVEKTGEDVPLSQGPSVILPMDDTKIYNTVKKIKKLHQDIKASVTWLAFWCLRQLALMHVRLKEVSGKVVRETK